MPVGEECPCIHYCRSILLPRDRQRPCSHAPMHPTWWLRRRISDRCVPQRTAIYAECPRCSLLKSAHIGKTCWASNSVGRGQVREVFSFKPPWGEMTQAASSTATGSPPPDGGISRRHVQTQSSQVAAPLHPIRWATSAALRPQKEQVSSSIAPRQLAARTTSSESGGRASGLLPLLASHVGSPEHRTSEPLSMVTPTAPSIPCALPGRFTCCMP
jgi:hypothetical protein